MNMKNRSWRLSCCVAGALAMGIPMALIADDTAPAAPTVGKVCEGAKGCDPAKAKLGCAGGACSAEAKPGCCAPAKAEAAIPTVTTEALAAALKQPAPPLLFDARSGKWDDGRRLPGAKSLNAASSDEEIAQAAPDKAAPIVTYCAGTTCPASGQLAAKLVKLGYTKVTEYPEGIAGWEKAGQPIQPPPATPKEPN